jgi:hypothetical protein
VHWMCCGRGSKGPGACAVEPRGGLTRRLAGCEASLCQGVAGAGGTAVPVGALLGHVPAIEVIAIYVEGR